MTTLIEKIPPVLEVVELAFESALVTSLIFARFPLFTSNILAFVLSVLGVGFATTSLYLLHRSHSQEIYTNI